MQWRRQKSLPSNFKHTITSQDFPLSADTASFPSLSPYIYVVDTDMQSKIDTTYLRPADFMDMCMRIVKSMEEKQVKRRKRENSETYMLRKDLTEESNLIPCSFT